MLSCSFPQEVEGMLLHPSLPHGQLALFQLQPYLESLTPENSLLVEGYRNFPISVGLVDVGTVLIPYASTDLKCSILHFQRPSMKILQTKTKM